MSLQLFFITLSSKIPMSVIKFCLKHQDPILTEMIFDNTIFLAPPIEIK
jgi:hypothetical protein